MEKTPKSKLKLLFADIIRGFSVKEDSKYGLIYLKHLNILESSEIDLLYEQYFNLAIKNNCPTEEEQVSFLKKEKLWSDEEDNKIRQIDEYISGLKKTLTQILAGVDKTQIKEKIKSEEKKLIELQQTKLKLIGSTAENFAHKKVNEYYIFNSLYKDKQLKTHLFDEEQFNDLEDRELGHILLSYNDKFNLFNTNTLQRIALNAFFLNLFYICKDNPQVFYGKSVIELTFLQSELFSQGMYFKNILSRLPDKPPEYLMDDPDGLIEYYNNTQNLDKVTNNQPKGENSVTCVMTTQEELKNMGVNNEGKKDVFAMMRKSGKTKMSLMEAVEAGMV